MDNNISRRVFPELDASNFHEGGIKSETSYHSSRPLEVVVDDREQPSGVIEHLMLHETIRVTVRRLKLGDYLVDNRVLIERKTVSDLSISIIDGRLFRQACFLAESAYRPLMLIEGHVTGEYVSGVSREAIQGAIITLAIFLDIPCLRSFDVKESANLIYYAGAQMQRNISRGVYRRGYRPKRRRNRQFFILQGLPGIGPARAEQLLETFGSIENVFRADVDVLSHVVGIGRKTAEAIRDLIGPNEEGRVRE